MLAGDGVLGRVAAMIWAAFLMAVAFSAAGEGRWASAGWFVGLFVAYVRQLHPSGGACEHKGIGRNGNQGCAWQGRAGEL